MLQFAQDVAQRLSGDDKLFRWRGPALVAVLNRPGKTNDVRIEVSRLVGQRREQAVQIRERTVLPPVAARCTVVPLYETASFEDVLLRLNAFINSAS